MQPTILHISNDYPDCFVPDKTKAVQRLVDGTPEFRHVVYSLNRINGLSGQVSCPFGEDRFAVAYRALPKGLLWESRLRDLAKWIEEDLKQRNIVPDLIEGHKFTVEGLIAQDLSKALGKPFICDIQGNTDVKILQIKKSLRARYRAIAAEVKLVFPYSVWPMPVFEKLTGLESSKCHILPVYPGFDTLTPSAVSPLNNLVTVFHLDSWSRKNIVSVLAALKVVKNKIPDATLDIYGRGAPGTVLKIDRFIQEAGLTGHARLMGPIPNNDLPKILGSYAGFMLPSKEETYGLVFAEALFSGLPVMFPKGWAIDGIFETSAIGYAADPLSVPDIANGIEFLLSQQAALKASIATMQSKGELNFVRQNSIIETYRHQINCALK